MLPTSTLVARKRDPARLRSVPMMFAIHPPERGIASEFENRTWKSAATLERFVERLHEIVDFFLANDERRQDFDDIHVVAGDLRQNPMPTQEGDNYELGKESVVDSMHNPPRQFQSQLRRFMEFNSDHEPFSTHFFDQGVLASEPSQPFQQHFANDSRVRYELFPFQDIKRREPAGHREIVPTERAGVNHCPVQPAKHFLVNRAPGDDGTARYKTAA
jgi:hypothetical protein